MKRRSFLRVVGSAVGTGAAAAGVLCAKEEPRKADSEEKTAGLPRRVLGRTGMRISIVGFPGLALIHQDQDAGKKAIHDAFLRGVNYFDNAPAYGKGDAEIKMGFGLQGLDRKQYYLACKTKARDKSGAREELERSLDRLKTSYFDVYQMHCLKQPDEVKEALGPGGAIETFQKAKEEGKVRHLGFSAHTTKSALTAMKQFKFDTVMFPINFVEFFTLGFGKQILELAHQQGAAVLAIKPMSRGRWPDGVERTRRWWYRCVEDESEVDLALRFTLSQQSVVAGFPPAFLDLLDKAINAGKEYRPITELETEKLRQLAQTCESVFRREEAQVAWADSQSEVFYPDSPHECCPGMHA